MNSVKNLLFILFVSITLSSCGGGGGNTGTSDKTGWKYNDSKYGGVEYRKPSDQKTAPGLVFIPGGAFIMGLSADDVPFEWDNSPRRVTLDSYYIDETEVTNQHYRDYLYWLSKVYESYPNVYKNAVPDSLVWRLPLAYNEPYVETYFRHPAYNNYPVVGVTWLQANDYCLWRTDRVNELELIKKGILNPNQQDQVDENNFNTDAYLAGQYEGDVKKNLRDLSSDDKNAERPVQFEDGILFPKYRLPTEAEFEYAATGIIGSIHDERILERRVYGWSGTGLRNPAKKQRGKMMANFQRGRGDLMGVTGSLNDGYGITAPIKSFPPNDFGLYDMVGNVNEWVLDVYRPMSFLEVEEFRPFRGNIFTEKATDEEGKLLEKDELGRIKYDTVGVVDRYNYRKGDNRSYRDGDIHSSIFFENSTDVNDSINSSDYVYFSGNKEMNNKGMRSLINDKSRVYKGGSFLDRPYWLRPSTRRYLDENKASVDIGFRCAMNSLGGEAKIKGDKKRK